MQNGCDCWVSLFYLVSFERRVETFLRQVFLQVSIEPHGAVLRDYDAELLLILAAKISQNALGHALKATLNHSLRHDNALNERFESTGDIEVTNFKLHVSPSQI